MNKRFTKTLTQVAVATALLSAASAASANSSNQGAKDAELEQIIVTANRSQQDKFLSLSATEVIGKAEIEAMQPQNVTELLNTIAGVTVVNQGGAGQASSVFMRGSSSKHTLVLVDGVRVGSATLGTTSFSTMSVALIDRIEVVKGPRGALWGSDAIGGVIQIFTKKLHSGEGVVSAGMGSHGFWKTEGAIGLGDEEHSLTLTAAAEKSGGFNATTIEGQEDDDGYDRQSFSLNGQSKVNDELTFKLVSRYEQGGSEYDSAFGNDESEHKNYSVKVGAVYTLDNLVIDGAYSHAQDQEGHFLSSASPKLVNYITTLRDQISVVGNYTYSENTTFAAGADWYQENVESDTSNFPVDTRNVAAVFAQALHQTGDFLFEGAIRYDDIEKVESETTYNLSAGYQLTADTLLSVTRSTGFKAPTFNDLYYPESAWAAGNPDLQPEKVTNNEFLLRHNLGYGTFEVSLYQADIKNLIDWGYVDGKSTPVNVDNAEIEGADISLSTYGEEFSHRVAVSYVKAEDKKTGDALIRRPELTANYQLSYQLDELSANLELDYRGKSYDEVWGVGRVELADVLLTNISVSYDFSEKLVVTGKINNLFDSEYTVVEKYLTDGTNYKLTATYSF